MKLRGYKKYIFHFTVIGLGLLTGWLIQPTSLEKYQGKLVNEQSQLLADGQHIQYLDYNRDGFSESFVYYHMSENRQPVVNQYSNTGNFQNVWYLNGEVVDNFDFITGDYNNDSTDEVFVFSMDQQGVYLYGLIPGHSNNFLIEKRNICNIPEHTNSAHIVIRGTKLADLNNDGYREVIFSINSRFSNTPRKLIAYDIANDTVISSPEFGMQLVGNPIIFDIDHNGTPEIFLSTLNSANQAWTSASNKGLYSASIVLNADLSYFFVPVLHESRMSVTSTFPFITDIQPTIATLSWSLNEDESASLSLLNTKGERIEKKRLLNKNFVINPQRTIWNQLVLYSKKGVIEKYNAQLNLSQTLYLKNPISQVFYVDMDKDGTEELITVHHNYLTIFRHNLSHPVKIEIPGLGLQRLSYSIKSNGNTGQYLALQSDNYQYLLSYKKNDRYWLNYVLFATLILALYLIYFILSHYYWARVNRAKFHNERFFEMQLDLIKSQLDPHFLFNALNSIAFSINKEDRKTAYANLGQFSKFMRESIVSMDEFSRTLDEEIGYVKNYLTLEKFRFKEKFDYDFIISPEIKKSVIVPKLIIFSFTESALKKSVLPKDGGGNIIFTIDTMGQDFIYISISENGLHRSLETSNENHTLNMMLMKRIVDYFNRFNNKKIEITIKDNGSPEKPNGSTVEILVPINYNYII